MNDTLTDRAILLAHHGTTQAVERFERGNGALSTFLDEAWDAAEERGDTELAGRLERAFNTLTGRA